MTTYTPTGWRRNELYLGGIYVGEVHSLKPHRDKWRGWFMSEADGDSIGEYETRDEAVKAVEAKLAEELAAIAAARNSKGD